MSVVALRLLDLRELGHRLPEADAATSGLSGEEREILALSVGRELVTVTDVLLAVGRLGGHMNRRSDGMPGWITLWRGMTKLRLLIEGARLGGEHRRKSSIRRSEKPATACYQVLGNDKICLWGANCAGLLASEGRCAPARS